MIKSYKNYWEELLLTQIKACKLKLPIREFKICPDRKWRSDFVWPEHNLIVEIEGGIYTNGRHTRPRGFKNDCEKYNYAALIGYKVIRVTPDHIKSGKALEWIEEGLKQ